jgi:hypothetical protein
LAPTLQFDWAITDFETPTVYLSLFIASKLAITIPFLAPRPYSSSSAHFSAFPSRLHTQQAKTHVPSPSEQSKGLSTSEEQFSSTGHNEAIIASRDQAAAPPVYLLVFAIIPFFASIYIASTRWSDFRHHGFDILFGYFIGTVTAIFAFRWYHLPISQGAGWSWGPRSRERAFWAGIGVGSYVGGEEKVVEGNGDVERGRADRDVRDDVGADGGHATVWECVGVLMWLQDNIELLAWNGTSIEYSIDDWERST